MENDMEIRNPEKREIAPNAPNPLDRSGNRWLLDGVEITGFTLYCQRMYAQEEGGPWTRPKGGVSENSIDA